MERQLEEAAARLLHHRRARMQRGDPVAPPVVPASTFYLPGDPGAANQYGRWTNPTWTEAEEALGVLENAGTVLFPSGMAAVAAVFYALLRTGDRILLPRDGYYTTRSLSEQFLRPMEVAYDCCPTAEYASQEFSKYRLVWVETPSNPGLEVCDLRSVISRARAAGALVAVDNTTMTPLGQRPLDLGADLVVSSDTKAMSGHADALMGHVASRDGALLEKILEWRRLAGVIPGPFEAWMLHRGLETLEVRFERMCATAGLLAARLARHGKVRSVRYPGLPADAAHAVACEQMLRFGFVLGVTLAHRAAADYFVENVRYLIPSTSFGSVHTSAERRARWGDQVDEGYIRLSIGCEPAEVLWDEMARVLGEL